MLEVVGCLYHKRTEGSGIKDWKKEYSYNSEKCLMCTYEETVWAGKGIYNSPEK